MTLGRLKITDLVDGCERYLCHLVLAYEVCLSVNFFVLFCFLLHLYLAGIDGQLKIMFFVIQTKTADYSVNWQGKLWLACKEYVYLLAY